jgi:hypothetical protein
MPKLTLSADKDVIEKAKRLAEARGTSVSAMFSRYIDSLEGPQRPRRRPAPITRRLRGLAKVSVQKSDRELYEAAILEKGRR